MKRRRDQIRRFLESLIQALFAAPGGNRFQRRLDLYCAVVFYLSGLWIWAQFFRFGNMAFLAADWYKELAFYKVIQQSLIDGTVPFHINFVFHGTNRFIAIPEIILAPQIVILKFVENIGIFFLSNALVLFTIGFFGCVAIRRKYELSTFSFVVFSTVFSFNGYITSHFAVGHTMWGGYFFLPWMFVVIKVMLEKHRSIISNALWLAMVLSLMFLHGSLHLLVGCIIYLMLIAIFDHRFIKVISLSFCFMVLLSSYRIFPAIYSFGGYEQVFETGIPTVRDLFDGLTLIKYPSMDLIGGISGAMYWWELDFFVGGIGCLFLVFFGVYHVWRHDELKSMFRVMIWPNIIVAILAMSYFYQLIFKLPLPLITVERIPSRMMIIPVVSILIMACVGFDRYCRRMSGVGALHVLACLGLAQTCMELMTHLRFWNVTSINAVLPAAPVLDIRTVTVPGDQTFMTVVGVSYGVSAVALIIWVVMALKLRLAKGHT